MGEWTPCSPKVKDVFMDVGRVAVPCRRLPRATCAALLDRTRGAARRGAGLARVCRWRRTVRRSFLTLKPAHSASSRDHGNVEDLNSCACAWWLLRVFFFL